MDIEKLAETTDDELLSLLGLYALPVMVDPDQALLEGRRGTFCIVASEALGGEFNQSGFRELGQKFLHKWGKEIARAICGNEELYKNVRERGLTQMGASVGLIAGCIATHVPALAPYLGLLTVLGALIAQTGFSAFCKLLAEYDVTKGD
jgi:hypothetical protein